MYIQYMFMYMHLNYRLFQLHVHVVVESVKAIFLLASSESFRYSAVDFKCVGWTLCMLFVRMQLVSVYSSACA